MIVKNIFRTRTINFCQSSLHYPKLIFHDDYPQTRYLSSSAIYNSSQDTDLVLIQPWSETNSAITKITLNNPRKMNVLSSEMMLNLIEKIQYANENITDSHCIVLNGNGKIFSSGHDLKELLTIASETETEGKRKRLQNIFQLCTKLMFTVRHSSLPIICMCHGLVAAAGLQLACASDMILASNECEFSTPGVNIGLFCSTPAIELSRNVGRKIAMQMLLTGEAISAQRALDVGLINDCCSSAEELRIKTEAMGMKIAAKSKPIIALGKKGFYEQIDLDLRTAHATSGECMVGNLYIDDCREGLNAFLEKRQPKWNHEK